jgi:peptide/nickel transport system substrate-binding protein
MRGFLPLVWISGGLALVITAWAALFAPDRERDPSTAIYATYVDLKEWDPAAAFSLEILVLANVYETLVYYDASQPEAPLQPALAESWTVSEDGLTWTFTLRPDVRFHDGSPLDAAAVVRCLQRTIDLKRGGAYIWDSVASIAARGSHEIKITTHFAAPIDLIASSQYAAFIYAIPPEEDATAWFNRGQAIGTGPYRLRQWDRNQQIVLEQNTAYWKPWESDQISRVIFKVVRESATQVQLLLAGQVDFASLVPVDLVSAMEAHPRVQVQQIASWKNSQLLLNCAKAPTDNLRFRQALLHAWDYPRVVNKIYAGSAVVSKGLIPDGMWGHDATLPPPSFDLARARVLLDESGVPPGQRKISVAYIASSSAYRDALELFQRNLATIGVEVELKPGPWGTIWDQAKNPASAPNAITMTWWPTYPTPSDWLTGLFRTEEPANFNLSYYSNPRYDALLQVGLAAEATDRAAAVAAYQSAQRLLLDDAVAIFFADLRERLIYHASITGLRPNPAYSTIFFFDLRRSAL